MLNNNLKYLLSLSVIVVLAGCSSDSRYHEIQSARLGECSHMADKEYHECVKQQQDSYKEFKKQQIAEQ
ncbi:hypothetical protein PUND_b0766 [Pseudoalteromonas undina]|jgi:uncharacterized lipoprotein|uniref:Orphan lipoprotein n=2 Tax=Pseudoalteromonas TaxID=53246 RepID=A0A7Y0DS38_9GAMM|nr:MULTISPECIES: hypothetical protein [Pseudoalteromonas]MDC2856622.1 hypothetical protein [Ningiella sp. W23]KAF7763388.1 hypothetical protein PUND_b0766 [Pseudoalteromonas undina]KPH91813.1 hypothetical protein AMS57_06935 [Pseudoalteromonas undina]MCK8124924.1 hypothetical protein [Pseudoalteromonas sp. 2CM39R]MDN3487107.1 hypothetical protein [Pseudoalteromonas sp. APC 3224]